MCFYKLIEQIVFIQDLARSQTTKYVYWYERISPLPLQVGWKQRVKGVYHIQNINNYHCRLKRWILEHFYIHPNYQGKGVGSKVLKNLLEQNYVKGKRVTLNVLQGSSARRLYERFGFKVESEYLIDVYMSVIVEENSRTVEGL